MLAFLHPYRAICCALALACALWSAAAWAAPAVTEFTIPTANSGPASITLGPDGNLWFVERNERKIGRISPNGTVLNEFPMPAESVAPYALTAGPDSNLWFIGTPGLAGRITQAGSVTVWPLGFDYPSLLEGDIIAGPDGNLWFTAGYLIGRFDPAGFAYEPFVLQGLPGAFGITFKSGSFDAAFWFTERAASKIGRITSDGVATEFGGLTPGSEPPDIAVGADGNLWFTERYADKIGRMTPEGVVTEFGGLTPGSRPFGIIGGPDGNLWFTENAGNRIGRITPSGTVTEFGGLTAASGPTSITRGPDNTLWFTESAGNRIGRVNVPACDAAETIPAAGGSFTRTILGGSTLAGTCGAPGPERVFKWTPERAGTALIETCGNGTDVDTAVYLRTGGCEGGAEVACNDDTCPTAHTTNRGSRLTPFVGEGQTYYIVVDGYGEGPFQLNVIPPGVGCTSPLVVAGSGGSYFGSITGVSGLQGTCGGAGPERVFQWTPERSGMATIQTCGIGSDFDTVLYVRAADCHRGTEVACDDDTCPNATGLERASQITMEVTAGETYFIFLDSFEHGGSYTLDIIGPTACDDVETLPAAGGVFSGTTQGAHTLIGSCGLGTGPEKVYRWIPEVSGMAVIDTCAGATFETLLYVREGDCENGAELACNQVTFCGPRVFSSRIFPSVVAEQTYYIVVDGVGGQSGDFMLSVDAPSTPAPTPTATPSVAASATPSRTATAAPSPTMTNTPSPTVSATPSLTAVASATPTHTRTSTITATATLSATPTATPSRSTTASASPTDTREVPTSTPTRTPTPSATSGGTATPTSTRTPTATPTATPVCRGDCSRDGTVTIAELIALINVALGKAPVDNCLAGDRDGNGVISVDELVAAVSRSLRGCGDR